MCLIQGDKRVEGRQAEGLPKASASFLEVHQSCHSQQRSTRSQRKREEITTGDTYTITLRLEVNENPSVEVTVY